MWAWARRKIFLKQYQRENKSNKNESENKKINFLSLLLMPGFFRSSKITTIIITNIQIKIEDPFERKKRK